MNSTSNSKYLQKLGLMRTTIQDAANQGDGVNELKIVDELCQIIRQGNSLKEFVFYCRHMTHEPNEEFLTDAELDANFDFNLIGTAGWGCLHAACSSGCQDIVEFLLIKK